MYVAIHVYIDNLTQAGTYACVQINWQGERGNNIHYYQYAPLIER